MGFSEPANRVAAVELPSGELPASTTSLFSADSNDDGATGIEAAAGPDVLGAELGEASGAKGPFAGFGGLGAICSGVETIVAPTDVGNASTGLLSVASSGGVDATKRLIAGRTTGAGCAFGGTGDGVDSTAGTATLRA